jgi:hypothetical protein
MKATVTFDVTSDANMPTAMSAVPAAGSRIVGEEERHQAARQNSTATLLSDSNSEME